MVRSRIENTVAYMLPASKNSDHALAVTLSTDWNNVLFLSNNLDIFVKALTSIAPHVCYYILNCFYRLTDGDGVRSTSSPAPSFLINRWWWSAEWQFLSQQQLILWLFHLLAGPSVMLCFFYMIAGPFEYCICVLFEWNLVGHAQKLLYRKYIF